MHLFPTKVHYLCFTCRKRWRSSDWHMSEMTCPQCGGRTSRVSKSIKTPRQADAKDWQELRLNILRWRDARSGNYGRRMLERFEQRREGGTARRPKLHPYYARRGVAR